MTIRVTAISTIGERGARLSVPHHLASILPPHAGILGTCVREHRNYYIHTLRYSGRTA